MWLSIFNSSKFKLLVSIWYCDMICRSWLQWGWLLLASRAKIPIAESDSMALFVQISVQRTHWRLSITLHHHVCLNTCTQHTLTLTHSPVVMKIRKYCRHLPHSPHSALIEMCLHVNKLGPGRQFRSLAAASSAPVRALLGCVAGCPVSWAGAL